MVHIQDTTPPTVTAPAGITVAAVDRSGTPASNPTIQAFLAGATAVDTVDGPLVPSNDAPTIFPLGTTVVTFTATDAAGNTGTATATVTVEDSPPTIRLTSPSNDSDLIEGTIITLGADADDDIGVTRVQFLVGGVSVGIDTAAPYTLDHRLAPGTGGTQVVIETIATDTLGQTARDAVTIIVLPDVTSPQVASVVPAEGAVEVSIATFIQVAFTERVDPATITTASFSVRADATAISGTFNFLDDNATVRFTPDGFLPFATLITIQLTSDITDEVGNPLADADGNPLTQPLIFTFTTGNFGITNPVNGSNVIEHTEILLEARGSIPLNIVTVAFIVNGQELPAVSGPPFTTPFTTPAAATTPTLTISAIARTSGGTEVAQDQVVVDVVVGLRLQPQLVGVPLGGTATLRLVLTSALTTDLAVELSTVDPTVVSLPDSVVLTAGQTERSVLVTGAASGNTTILANSSLGTPAAIVSVSEPVAGKQLTALAPAVGMVVLAPPSVGQAITAENSQQSLTVRLLSSPATEETPVAVTSSDPAVADVLGQVVIPAGEQTLTLRAGEEVRELTVFVGAPPAGRIPPIVARPVGVVVLVAPSVGQAIAAENSEQTVTVRLLSEPAAEETPVAVTSSDPAVADVLGQVVIPAGEQVATLTIKTGMADVLGQVVIPAGEQVATLTIKTGTAGEATLTLRAGTEVRQLTVFVGAPPAGRIPPIVARPVGVVVLAAPSVGQAITAENSQQSLTVRLLSSPAAEETPVAVTSSDPAVADVIGQVVIPAGEQVATLTIETGEAGEATLTLRAGEEVRELTVFVGIPPPGRVPPIVAPIVGIEVEE
jgi:hypothetical protein